MIPLLSLGIGAASSILGRLLHSSQPAAQPQATDSDFKAELAKELQRIKKTSAPATDNIQTLLAQQNTAPLPLDKQLHLGQMLLGKNVQLADAAGNSFVAHPTHVVVMNGQAHLVANGHAYAVSSVRAVLEGVSNT